MFGGQKGAFWYLLVTGTLGLDGINGGTLFQKAEGLSCQHQSFQGRYSCSEWVVWRRWNIQRFSKIHKKKVVGRRGENICYIPIVERDGKIGCGSKDFYEYHKHDDDKQVGRWERSPLGAMPSQQSQKIGSSAWPERTSILCIVACITAMLWTRAPG